MNEHDAKAIKYIMACLGAIFCCLIFGIVLDKAVKSQERIAMAKYGCVKQEAAK